MNESERLERYKSICGYSENIEEALKYDEETSQRIMALFNDSRLKSSSMVDAKYFDYSEIPHDILDKEHICRDSYLIYGITESGEFLTKWVDRDDLDSRYPIVDGKVIYPDNPLSNGKSPEIIQSFNTHILFSPIPEPFFRDFPER